MCKVLIFGGTTEGRRLADYCSVRGIPAYVSVVSEYGKDLLKEDPYIRPLTGAMDSEQMKAWIEDKAIELVIDATHPYAANATENIKKACRAGGTRYLRCLRRTETSAGKAGDRSFGDFEEAVKWLEQTEGNILITTGSNELAVFAKSDILRERIFARILPSSSVIKKCEDMGISGKHLLCMQGPFTKEMNAAMLHQTDAVFLVTKESGKEGGFDEKLKAAEECGVSVVIIGHPAERGVSMSRICAELNRFSVKEAMKQKRTVCLAGIGPGAPELMTEEVKKAILQGDFLIGAARMLQAALSFIKQEKGKMYQEDLPFVSTACLAPQVLEELQLHKDWRRAVILCSGDSGFFSGAGRLVEKLAETGYKFRVLPGISSVSYFAARLGTAWDDALLETAHGRKFDVAALEGRNRKIFLLTGGENSVGELCRRLVKAGFGQAEVTVGERLSYPEERITRDRAENLSGGSFDPLSIVLINSVWMERPSLPQRQEEQNEG